MLPLKFLKKNNAPATYSISRGSWNEAIAALIIRQKFDLVLISQKSRLPGKGAMNINPDKIAAKTDVPVITVPADMHITGLRSVTVPVTDFLPLRKLVYGIYLSPFHNTTLKLVGIETPGTRKKVNDNLAKAYRLVKDNSNVSVELEIIDSSSDNIADAINGFAIKQSASLFIVNPFTQTKMPGLFSFSRGHTIQ